MKKSILFFLFSTATLISSAQTNVDAIKKELTAVKSENLKLKDENKYLKEKVVYCSALSSDTLVKIVPFSSQYEVQILSCKGNRATQTVKIEMIIQHSNVNQVVRAGLNNSSAIDILGQQYQFSQNNIMEYNVFTDTPMKLTYEIKNILPGTDMFKKIAILMSTANIGVWQNPNQFTEITNLKINW